MNRRTYLTLFVGLGSATLAGCLDSVPGMDDEDAVEPADNFDSEAQRQADRDIRRAVGSLNKAAASLQAVESQLEDPENVDFDAGEPTERIDDGREHLESATAEATDDGREDVAELRSYADVLARLTDVTETVADGDLEADLETIQSDIEAREFEAARASLDDQQRDTEAARDRLEPAFETLEELDRERLESRDTVAIADLEAGAETLSTVLDGLEALETGFASIVTGYEHLDAGKHAFEEGGYKPAKGEFETARGAFEDASGAVEAGRTDAPDGLVDHFETASCRSTTLESAATAYVDSATAASDGDDATADDRWDDGEALLEDADRCGE
ncbi:hypothetical protein [Halomontanus rarus]|uniref:hypothetical protein n=1 Tax=Halomontanus rarus TaxID=3034020 RepID=UPI0023E7FD93|nr:hypothetical protein [Halovivax sp. TS33]